MNRRLLLLSILTTSVAGFVACGGPEVPTAEIPPLEGGETTGGHETPEPVHVTKQEPPASGPARDIAFPPIQRVSLDNGLELNTVEWHQLPVVYLRLVVRSGAERDPEALQGLSDLVAQMLQEGTRRQNSARLAERIEFLGADLWTGADEENVQLVFRALSDHLDEAMDILAEVATSPAFNAGELEKLKRRERDRLALMSKRPNFLARRALYSQLYGDHPYGRVDTTEAVLRRVRRNDLVRWHRTHFVPSNSFLVAVGDVTPERIRTAAERAFGRWRGRDVPAVELPALPERTEREILVVDRPGAVQSVILMGNLALARQSEDYVQLMVANQVLGGSAASRLFMDLRERRSLTYGAYSQVGERVGTAPFISWAAVRTEVTGEAVGAFFENLDRIVTEAPPAEELRHAQRYLSDSFPLKIDTPGKIASLVADLRVFGLPDNYWETYRTSIGQVSSAQSLAVAQRYIRPEQMLVLVVGNANEVAEGLRTYGPVTVVDENMEPKARFDQQTMVPSEAPEGGVETGGPEHQGESPTS